MEFRDIPKVDGQFARAVGHPLRVRFLQLLADRDQASPREALAALEDGGGVLLSQLNYHASVLERFGFVEAVGRPDRRGGVSFRATDAGGLVMLAIGSPKKGGRA